MSAVNQPSTTAQVSLVLVAHPFFRVCLPAVGMLSIQFQWALWSGLCLACQRQEEHLCSRCRSEPDTLSPAALQQMHLRGIRSIFKRVKYLALFDLMQRAKNMLKNVF